MRSLGLRRMAMALTMVAASTVMSTVGTASTANAATSPLNASQHPIVHVCNGIGDAVSPYDHVDYQAVVCVDLKAYTVPQGNGLPDEPYVEADIEMICQVGPNQAGWGTPVQCAHAKAQGSLSNGFVGQVGYVNWVCGHQYGPCSSTRNIWNIATSDALRSPACAYDVGFNWWAVVFGDPSVDGGGVTGIELPGSGKWVYLNELNSNGAGGNETSGHFQICS